MTVFQRILVPIDGSGPSEAALDLSLQLAKDWSSDLILCNIVDSDRIVAECASTTYGDPQPIIDAMMQSAEQLLSHASDKAQAGGLSCRTHLRRESSIVLGILALARSEKAALIVMGSHGRRGLSRLVMGSTTEGVIRSSEIPVLVVRESREQKPVARGEAHAVTKT